MHKLIIHSNSSTFIHFFRKFSLNDFIVTSVSFFDEVVNLRLKLDMSWDILRVFYNDFLQEPNTFTQAKVLNIFMNLPPVVHNCYYYFNTAKWHEAKSGKKYEGSLCCLKKSKGRHFPTDIPVFRA